MTVTTGGRGFKLSLVSSFATSSTISSSRETTLTTPLNDSASVVAVGTSSAWLMLAKTPRSSRFFNKSFARTSSFSASSRIVMPSVIVTSRGGRGSGGAITAAAALRPAPGRCRVGCSLRSPSCSRLSKTGRWRCGGLRVYSGLPGSAFGGNFSGNGGGSIPGRPGARGPGRVPVGIGPRRCSKGRDGGPPGPPGLPDRGVKGRPWPVCWGRIGGPGRGPLEREPCEVSGKGPRLPVGIGPRFPVGNGRAGAPGLAGAPGRPGAAAAGRMAEGCLPDGVAGRAGAAGRAAAVVPGAPAGGRVGVAAGAVVAGAAGFAAGGNTAGTGAGALGATGPAAAGASGAIGFATGAAGTAGALGFAAAGATLAWGGATVGAAGLNRAALAAASFASFSALATASTCASASAAP